MASHQLYCRALLPIGTDRAQKVSNGFAINLQSDLVPSSYLSLAATIEAFYNTTPSGHANPISYFLSQSLSRATNACEVAIYDATGHLGVGSKLGPPVFVNQFTLGGGDGNQPLPAQVASVISWRADYGTDVEFGTHTRPRADDRARIFLGPLSVQTIGYSTDTPPLCEFTPAWISLCGAALEQLYTQLGTLNPVSQLCVWSRKMAAYKPAVDRSMDLAPDTQRRRADYRPRLVWTPF